LALKGKWIIVNADKPSGNIEKEILQSPLGLKTLTRPIYSNEKDNLSFL
jgi:hypothetical protein